MITRATSEAHRADMLLTEAGQMLMRRAEELRESVHRERV